MGDEGGGLAAQQLCMVIEAAKVREMPDAVVPTGYVVRGYQRGDEGGWAETLQRAGFVDWDAARVLEYLADADRRSGSVVVEFKGSIVASTFASRMSSDRVSPMTGAPGQPQLKGVLDYVATASQPSGTRVRPGDVYGGVKTPRGSGLRDCVAADGRLAAAGDSLVPVPGVRTSDESSGYAGTVGTGDGGVGPGRIAIEPETRVASHVELWASKRSHPSPPTKTCSSGDRENDGCRQVQQLINATDHLEPPLQER